MRNLVSLSILASCALACSVLAPACGGDAGTDEDAGTTPTEDAGAGTGDAGGGGGDAARPDAGGGDAGGGDAGDAGPGASYTVGGAVTGLDGTGLVLTSGGADVNVPANGNFAFPAQADGSAYAVTVKTQPTNKSQTCTVTNGAGTVAGANVTNVAVACATNSFTVGGSITGLAAGSVVLTNNGADDLTRNANGAFTFATPVASGGAYAVAVKTQPEGLYCSVATGSGTVAAANVTNVAVSCVAATSCKAIKAANGAAPNGVYTIAPAGTAYAVYCDMTTDGGGWTLAMKGAAGSAAFVYSAAEWTNAGAVNAGSTNLTAEDAKFQAFDDLPMDEVRAQTTNAAGNGTITLANPAPATTLLSIFQGGTFRATNLGRAAWLASQNGTILQPNCNEEGFNVNGTYAKARIGLQANQENDCGSSDSVVGIGVAATSCGNASTFSSGFHSGPQCGPHDPAVPAVAGVAADFWVWVR